MQEKHNSITNALELCLSWINPSILSACVNPLVCWVRNSFEEQVDGVTEALSMDFSIKEISNVEKVFLRFFNMQSYLTSFTAAKLWQHMSNMKMMLDR